jgi:uncharacterized protein YjbI with pentapeptide repeats
MKKVFSILLIWVVFTMGSLELFAFDRASVERLLRTKKCPGCDFYRAKLDRLDLRGADLKGARLAYATFREATLYAADLEGADLRGTVFDGAIWTDGSVCQAGSVGECRRKQP